jgi:hypothetical protein
MTGRIWAFILLIAFLLMIFGFIYFLLYISGGIPVD